ncbi:hypothetical protein BC938DRAFT_471319 [Jimgerdemannia flammicorona]|uniref:Uncharacterized protein n=1 Tax=Jimgerdemannia flammicorona TaxID=994334 RepID=A0A433QUS2_9FUNG|nr:hypothetical protein BC938DRAFT_471319 [Jimgerdemannia flammicorona]
MLGNVETEADFKRGSESPDRYRDRVCDANLSTVSRTNRSDAHKGQQITPSLIRPPPLSSDESFDSLDSETAFTARAKWKVPMHANA